ncbi:hypothetical protein K438DRAFT_1836272 [Mycena galopus ATCC 62051]|nr:hypothetical protein K438DRAFT_1836272 [Mycena galopus ATCC 62051]
MADPFFEDAVPDIYTNFLAITRFHQHLDVIIHPYPNRPVDFERGVNMPFIVNVLTYLQHLISQWVTLDGNYKANLFYKRDDGSNMALTDGRMYFPKQTEFEEMAKLHVVNQEDTEVLCKAHIGSVHHQGLPKYRNTAVSSVIACTCDHTVVGSFVDMLKGEAYSRTPMAQSYDGYCSFVVNMVKRAHEMFPEQEWLHELLVQMEGQIPADHINGHGPGCQAVWQAVYFNCRAHFHRETVEML